LIATGAHILLTDFGGVQEEPGWIWTEAHSWGRPSPARGLL